MDEHRATAVMALVAEEHDCGSTDPPTQLRAGPLTLEERIADLELRLAAASRHRLELSRWCAELEAVIRARAELFEAVVDLLLHAARGETLA